MPRRLLRSPSIRRRLSPRQAARHSPLASQALSASQRRAIQRPHLVNPVLFPAGVAFNASSGILSGTPSTGTGGSYPITFTAHNGVGVDSTQSFVLNVNQNAAITSPTGVTVVSFTIGSNGTFPVNTTGTPSPSLSETGKLPSGVTFVDNNNGTGTLSEPRPPVQ